MADKKEIQKHQARRGNCMTDEKKRGGGGKPGTKNVRPNFVFMPGHPVWLYQGKTHFVITQ